MQLADTLRGIVRGEVFNDSATLDSYSRDASIFEVQPAVVVCPKDVEDIRALVRFVYEERANNPSSTLSITVRAAGTDMTGGPLGESVVLDVTKYLNRIIEVGDGYAVAEPGVLYRDFEKATLAQGYLMPAFPASRERCALGGMVANNAGGEKTLRYGKVADYVESLSVVLADGNEYEVRSLTLAELNVKKSLQTFEGKLYRDLHALISEHRDVIAHAKPNVSKNSAGYALWDVLDGERFNLARLIVGSQGTLGIVTKIRFRLVRPASQTGMLVIFLQEINAIADIVRALTPFRPVSIESFDRHTFKLALLYWRGFATLLARNVFSLALRFIPDAFRVFVHGMPALVLLVEFEGETVNDVTATLARASTAARALGVDVKVVRSEGEAQKYRTIRRESYAILRERVQGKQTAAFIDDVIVRPEKLPSFLPKLTAILERSGLVYTVAGHMGDGNFHIIPLITLADATERAKIIPLMDEVYGLVFACGGSMTAEHNDGLIRTPYLAAMFGKKICKLFADTKQLFDPHTLFNPRKKVGGEIQYAVDHMRQN